MIETLAQSGIYGWVILVMSLLLASWSIFTKAGPNRVLFFLPLVVGLLGTWLGFEEMNSLKDGYGYADPALLEPGLRQAKIPAILGGICTGILWLVEFICVRIKDS